jgi:hypothetical protein
MLVVLECYFLEQLSTRFYSAFRIYVLSPELSHYLSLRRLTVPLVT